MKKTSWITLLAVLVCVCALIAGCSEKDKEVETSPIDTAPADSTAVTMADDADVTTADDADVTTADDTDVTTADDTDVTTADDADVTTADDTDVTTAGDVEGTTESDENATLGESLNLVFAPDGSEGYVVIDIGDCTEKDIVIPAVYNSLPVVAIGERAFERTAITSIVIPSSVKTIGTGAFDLCTSLKTVTFSEGLVLILSKAFSDCTSLDEVKLPNSVSYIGVGVFGGCTKLSVLEINADNETYYSSGNCIVRSSDGVVVAGCKTSIIPQGVTAIGEEAFVRCWGMTAINIPRSVTLIDTAAFSGCIQLRRITFGGSQSEWFEVDKVDGWDESILSYVVNCVG